MTDCGPRALWRFVARINDYDVRVAHAKGEHVWHVHDDTDEFFLVLDGQLDIALRDLDGGGRTVVLRKGDTFVVSKGHAPQAIVTWRRGSSVRTIGNLDDR